MDRIMLKFLYVCFLLGCVFPLQAQVFSEDIQFEERVFDFGEIEEKDGLVSHEFVFKNRGQKTISISNVTSGCGCVSFEFPKEPVRPNAGGKVEVTYNPAYRPGFFSKEIAVLTNNNANYNRIWVKGTVVPCQHPVSENYPYEYGMGLWMNLEVVAMGTINVGQEKTIKLKYANDSDADIQLLFVVVGGNKDIIFTSPRLVKAHEEGIMPITYRNTSNYSARTNVYPVVNGKVLVKPFTVTYLKPTSD